MHLACIHTHTHLLMCMSVRSGEHNHSDSVVIFSLSLYYHYKEGFMMFIKIAKAWNYVLFSVANAHMLGWCFMCLFSLTPFPSLLPFCCMHIAHCKRHAVRTKCMMRKYNLNRLFGRVVSVNAARYSTLSSFYFARSLVLKSKQRKYSPVRSSIFAYSSTRPELMHFLLN